MTVEDIDTGDVRHPRDTMVLYGHDDAERTLLDAYKSGRLPHAWLIGGPAGVGKATLAYRMARFVLAHPDASTPDVQAATSLAVPDGNPAARKMSMEVHPGLLVIKREINENTGKLFTETRIDDVRRTVPFFGSTAGDGGWRIAIVDPVEDMNRAGTNALLKVVEEPPPNSLLLLVSDAPSRVLATIRSRCRKLVLRPLAASDVARAAGAALGIAPTGPEIAQAVAAADGSVARAIDLMGGKSLELQRKVADLLSQLPNPDPRSLHALGDAIGGHEPKTLAAFMEGVNGWFAERLKGDTRDTASLARLAQAWEKANSTARDAERFNLDRKPLVFAVFGLLAEAARG